MLTPEKLKQHVPSLSTAQLDYLAKDMSWRIVSSGLGSCCTETSDYVENQEKLLAVIQDELATRKV